MLRNKYTVRAYAQKTTTKTQRRALIFRQHDGQRLIAGSGFTIPDDGSELFEKVFALTQESDA
jgi:hypothetical protein